jgi:hypothetical protein
MQKRIVAEKIFEIRIRGPALPDSFDSRFSGTGFEGRGGQRISSR